MKNAALCLSLIHPIPLCLSQVENKGGRMKNDERTKAPFTSTHPARTVRPVPQNPGDCFISKTDVAVRLGKTPRTIEHWMRQGVIPYIKIGKGRRATVLFKWADIEAHLKANFGVGSNDQ
jgi:hypothetical protein